MVVNQMKPEIRLMKSKCAGVAMLAAVAMVSAIISTQAEHHEKKSISTGSGAYWYSPVDGWGLVPGSDGIGSTHGSVAVASDGRIFVPTDTARGILIFNPKGEYQGFFGSEFSGIHHLLIRQENGVDYIYAAHLSQSQAIKITLDGKVVWTLPYPEASGIYKAPNEYKPTSIAVAPNGDVFVTDGYGKNYIHKYTSELAYVKSFGGRGAEPGKFNTPHGIGIDTRGEKPMLMVCDRENRRLQYFDLDGEYVSVFAPFLRRPCSVSFQGDMAVVAELQGRVTLLDKNNNPVAFLGDNPDNKFWANFGTESKDWVPGIFTAPHGACFDHDGNILVMDWNVRGRITKLVKSSILD